jgi:hypothetical protein
MIKGQDSDPHEGEKLDLDPHVSDAGLQPALWIRIRTPQDPEAMKFTKIIKYAGFPAFQKGFCTYLPGT